MDPGDPDPEPDPQVRGKDPAPDPSITKQNSKKNLHSCFVTSSGHLEKLCKCRFQK
jgi:hypothetical protein